MESANFLHSHLLNGQNIVLDTIFARANDSCGVSGSIWPLNSGLMIEVLSILRSITQNASTQTWLNEIISAAIAYSGWQANNGIIAYMNPSNGNQKTGDMNLVRGLGAAYVRNTTNATLNAYIGSYLAVQFNAVIDLA
ncbi:hypothetical protein DFH09DRAFT_1032859, partial [Mycena vulgaris]